MQQDKVVIDLDSDEVSVAGRSKRIAMSCENKKVQKNNEDTFEVNASDIDWCSLQKDASSNNSLPNSDEMREICSLENEDPDLLMAMQLQFGDSEPDV